MASVLVMSGPGSARPVLDADALARLGELGVTRVIVLGSARSQGIVLEGWALDPTTIETAVGAMFPDGTGGVQTLHQRVVMSMTPRERSESWDVASIDGGG